MTLVARRQFPSFTTTLTASAIALAVLATANHFVARLTERRHPPKGSFVEVDGVRLHYSDRGQGSPIVLIHGNMVTGDDYDTSGVAEILLRHRKRELTPTFRLGLGLSRMRAVLGGAVRDGRERVLLRPVLRRS